MSPAVMPMKALPQGAGDEVNAAVKDAGLQVSDAIRRGCDLEGCNGD